jgi:hypothetical protein
MDKIEETKKCMNYVITKYINNEVTNVEAMSEIISIGKKFGLKKQAITQICIGNLYQKKLIN